MASPVQIGSIAVLFFLFLNIKSVSESLGSQLDTLPMRFAAVISILAALSYDRFIALALFLVIVGIYIQHHNNDLTMALGSKNSDSGDYSAAVESIQDPSAMKVLHRGGYADESHDIMDFIPKTSDQDNQFESVGSIDEKHVLQTEQLGSKSQSLFSEDLRAAHAMERDNSYGSA